MEERAIEENIKLAQVIAETNYANQKTKMESVSKKLEVEEKGGKSKSKSKSFEYFW